MSFLDQQADESEKPDVIQANITSQAVVPQTVAAPEGASFLDQQAIGIDTQPEVPQVQQPVQEDTRTDFEVVQDNTTQFSVGSILKRNAAGIADSAINVNRANQNAIRGLMKVPGGVVQATLGALDAVWGPITDPRGTKEPTEGFEDQFTRSFNETFQKQSATKRANWAESFAVDAAEFGGEVLPSLFMPTRTLTQAVGGGGAIGATQFNEGGLDRSTSALIGGGLGTIGHGIARGVDFFTDLGGFMSKGLSKADAEKRLAEGTADALATGTDLKFSERLGSNFAVKVEGFTEASPAGMELARQGLNKRLTQIQTHFEGVINKLDPRPDNRFFGQRVAEGYTSAVKQLKTARQAQGDIDFPAAAKQAAGIPIVKTDNLLAALDDTIKKFDGDTVRTYPKMKLFLNQLQKTKESLSDVGTDARRMTIEEFQGLMRTHGQVQKGTGGLISNSPGHDDYANRKIMDALRADLDAAVESGLPGADLLRVARDNWSSASDKVDEVSSHALAKLFKTDKMPAPEEIENVFSRLHPTQLKSAMQILKQVDPGIHGATQRFWLAEAMQQGVKKGSNKIGEVSFSPEAALKVLKDDKHFTALFPDARVRGQVDSGIRVLKRLMQGAKPESGGGLAPAVREAAGVALSLDATFFARLIAGQVMPGKLAKTLLTREGVESLRVIAKPNRTPAALTKAILTLEQIGNAKEPAQREVAQ